jgi:hypothetical protein
MDTYATPRNSTTARRRMLGLAARSAALGGAAVVLGQNRVAHAQEQEPLVGSWLVAGTPSGAQPGPPRLLVSFVPGGVALRTAPLQQSAPPALGTDKMFISTTHGAWTRTGDNSFGLTFQGFAFNAAGEFLAMQRIRVAVELDEDLDRFSGYAKTDFIGVDGQVVASGIATVQGTRIQAESPA